MLADGEVIEYKDSATDVAFIAVVRKVSRCCAALCGASYQCAPCAATPDAVNSYCGPGSLDCETSAALTAAWRDSRPGHCGYRCHGDVAYDTTWRGACHPAIRSAGL